MPQLSDLIQAGRSAEKTDDVIWKELSSQGWADADISQALGGVASPMPSAATTPSAPVVVSTGGVSGLAIGLGLLAVVALGVGGYYMATSSRTASTLKPIASMSQAPNATPQKTATAFSCADVLSISDVQGFTQDASPVEVELDDSSSGIVVCSFTQPTSSIAVTVSTDAGISARQMYDITRSTWANNVEIARTQGRDTSKLEVKDVQGIGTAAFSAVVAFMPTIGVLSADGQAFFTVGVLSDTAAARLVEIATLVEVRVGSF